MARIIQPVGNVNQDMHGLDHSACLQYCINGNQRSSPGQNKSKQTGSFTAVHLHQMFFLFSSDTPCSLVLDIEAMRLTRP